MKMFIFLNPILFYWVKIVFVSVPFFLCVNVCMAQKSGGEIKRNKNSAVTPQKSEANSIYFTDYSKVRIGDYFYSDGSLSHQKGTKKCIGVVFSLQTTNEEKKHGWTHGQVWGIKKGFKYPGCGVWGPRDSHPALQVKTIKEGRNDLDGYKHTIEMQYNNGSIFSKARNYTPQPPSSKTSGWYIPTIGQWIIYLEGLGKTKVNDSGCFDSENALKYLSKYGLKAAWIWIGNETDNDTAWYVHITHSPKGYFFDSVSKDEDLTDIYSCEMCFAF